MKHFLFDIGHVLVDFETGDFLNEVARETGRPVEPLSEQDLETVEEVEKGQISDAEFVEYLNESMGLSWTVADLVTTWARMFRTNETGRDLFLDAVEEGVPVYMLSNIAQHHVDAIRNKWSGFFDKATGLFLSYQIGVRKPDPFIYRYALKEIGTNGDQCLFLDDRPENVDAAREAGIHAYQFIPENYSDIRKAAAGFFGLS